MTPTERRDYLLGLGYLDELASLPLPSEVPALDPEDVLVALTRAVWHLAQLPTIPEESP